MAAHNHIDTANATGSSIIGIVSSFILHHLLPWAGHTIGAILSAIIVAFCVYKFNNWLKKREKKNESKNS